MRKEKQGIVSILGPDSERTKTVPSLRRTLSADMSSKKWISHMKKVASSEEISISIDGSEYEENQIQEENKKKGDIWSSIVSQKDNNSSKSNPPYIHPHVKRSASSLSEKSLEICTESLGSETGSDGFSSFPSSETGDGDYDELNQHDQTPVKYNYKKSPPRSFLPPLPSLTSPDGGSLRMQPRRDNGRLVLNAIAIPSRNNFHAQRQDGRLILTLVKEKQQDEFVEETKQNNEPEFSSGLLNAHRLATMMTSKSIVLANRNHSTPISHSLPPRPKMVPRACLKRDCDTQLPPPTSAVTTAAASLNAYEYYWKSKTTAKAAATVNPLGQHPQSFKNSGRKLIVYKNRTANEQQPLMRQSNGSCKEVKRSLLIWEPYCIATS